MRTTNVLKLVTAIVMALGFTSVQAASLPQPFSVSTSVTSTCTFAAVSNLAFGAYTSNQPLPADASTPVTANCSSGTAYSIGMSPGLYWGSAWAGWRALGSNANRLAYSLKVNAQNGAEWGDGAQSYSAVGTGADQAVLLVGRIPASQSAAAGSYTDSVVATLTY